MLFQLIMQHDKLRDNLRELQFKAQYCCCYSFSDAVGLKNWVYIGMQQGLNPIAVTYRVFIENVNQYSACLYITFSFYIISWWWWSRSIENQVADRHVDPSWINCVKIVRIAYALFPICLPSEISHASEYFFSTFSFLGYVVYSNNMLLT